MKKETKRSLITLGIIIGSIFGSIGAFYGISVLVLGTTMPYSVVMSESMRPTLNEGDIVIVKQASIGEIQVGDIIVFWKRSISPLVPIVHRVINITAGPYYETQGDNNQGPDHPDTPYSDVIGKVVFILKYLGLPAYYINTAGGTVLIWVLIIGIIIVLIYLTIKGDGEEIGKGSDELKKDEKELK